MICICLHVIAVVKYKLNFDEGKMERRCQKSVRLTPLNLFFSIFKVTEFSYFLYLMYIYEHYLDLFNGNNKPSVKTLERSNRT